MDWGSIIGGVLGAVGGASSSGNSQQTQSKDPWAAAQPWMASNLGLGQNLQSQYMANPLSQYQQSAYSNAAGTNNQIRSMASTIIPQLSNIKGFDRTNPLAKPAGIDLSGALTGGMNATGTSNTSGNLGFSVNPGNAQQLADLQAQIAAPRASQAQAQQAGVAYRSNGGGGNGGVQQYGGAGDYGPMAALLGNLGYTGLSNSLASMNDPNGDGHSVQQVDAPVASRGGWGNFGG